MRHREVNFSNTTAVKSPQSSLQSPGGLKSEVQRLHIRVALMRDFSSDEGASVAQLYALIDHEQKHGLLGARADDHGGHDDLVKTGQ